MSQPVWYLVIQQGPNVGSAYPLRSPIVAIGRSADNQVVLDDTEVSRHHARLTWQGNAYMLEDLGSANGTWVNGARITSPVLLRPGDSIGLGKRVSLALSDHPQVASLARYASAYPTTAGAPSARAARTNWGLIAAMLGALVLLLALAAVVLAVFALRKGDSPSAASSTQTAQSGAVLVITATPSPTDTPLPTVPPTYTPYPTYTPVPTDPPTYTPYPTYTPMPTEPPTYTPYPTYTPIPTEPPTYTPYPTYTPLPTQKPLATKPQPTATPTPTSKPSPPYTIAINKTVLEPWGRPRNPDGCNGPYNDRDPVRRFTVEVILTNFSNRYIPDGWFPAFYTAKGQAPPTCIWWYENTAVEPGETIYVTFATHVESDDWVRAMVFDELNYEVTTCFNAAAQVVACR
jgi:predicted component of type VI protein secretion system